MAGVVPVFAGAALPSPERGTKEGNAAQAKTGTPDSLVSGVLPPKVFCPRFFSKKRALGLLVADAPVGCSSIKKIQLRQGCRRTAKASREAPGRGRGKNKIKASWNMRRTPLD